jgi:hypothetical protein
MNILLDENIPHQLKMNMETLLIKVTSKAKAKMLAEMLKEMRFVAEVVVESQPKAETNAEHTEMKQSIVKRKNKAFAKYLE